MPRIWRLCAWLAAVGLLVACVPRPYARGGLSVLDALWLALIPAGAEHAARHRGPAWAFSVYGAVGGAVFVPATLSGAEWSFRAHIDRRAATVTEYVLLWAALVAGMALLCYVIGRRASRDVPAGRGGSPGGAP